MTYVQGFVTPAVADRQQDYVTVAARFATVIADYGALRLVECWGDDVPAGQVTDFRRAVAAGEGEQVVFSWIVWPDKATCQAATERLRTDERLDGMDDLPFDPRRMIFAGFVPVFDTGAGS